MLAESRACFDGMGRLCPLWPGACRVEAAVSTLVLSCSTTTHSQPVHTKCAAQRNAPNIRNQIGCLSSLFQGHLSKSIK
uniref:Uncharacterized protein n=1 Tax=Anguilla anguilla TaxID=7936 RepID=A0A0E9WRC4_ANGAN